MERDYLGEWFQLFSFILIMSLFLIGVPATVWKALCVQPLRPTGPGGRSSLLGKSVASTSAVGIASIFAFTVMFSYVRERNEPMSDSIWPVFLVTAAMLIFLVATMEWRAFRQFTAANGHQTLGASCIWLLVGNLWILWALFLMLSACAMWASPVD